MNLTLQQFKRSLKLKPSKFTLCYFFKERQILLGKKKGGVGMGKWVGIGGKVELGENYQTAAIREIIEEIQVQPLNIKRVATVKFYFPDATEIKDIYQEVGVFTCDHWQGEPVETREIKPQWFNEDQLPYEEMWADSQYWLPQVIAGNCLKAEFLFSGGLANSDQQIITDYKLREVNRF